MAHTFTQLYYHFIWGTKLREPYITEELEERLYAYIRSRCRELGIVVHALNGMEDHTHLACSLPVTLSIADALDKLKGSSSHFANHAPDFGARLYWQPGYGALTFTRQELPRVTAYVTNQKQHHRERSLWGQLERVDE
ncbi:MAG: IS200/IS605 family transposase [Actinomycetota bacterium]